MTKSVNDKKYRLAISVGIAVTISSFFTFLFIQSGFTYSAIMSIVMGISGAISMHYMSNLNQ
jgi:uncharacterized membrane protein YccC